MLAGALDPIVKWCTGIPAGITLITPSSNVYTGGYDLKTVDPDIMRKVSGENAFFPVARPVTVPLAHSAFAALILLTKISPISQSNPF